MSAVQFGSLTENRPGGRSIESTGRSRPVGVLAGSLSVRKNLKNFLGLDRPHALVGKGLPDFPSNPTQNDYSGDPVESLRRDRPSVVSVCLMPIKTTLDIGCPHRQILCHRPAAWRSGYLFPAGHRRTYPSNRSPGSKRWMPATSQPCEFHCCVDRRCRAERALSRPPSR